MDLKSITLINILTIFLLTGTMRPMGKDYNPTFFQAVWDNNRPLVAKLLSSGCSPDITSSINQNRPLHIAARQGYIEIVALLIEQGANLNGQNKFGDTPLHYAATQNKSNVASYLLKAGAQANIANHDGLFPADQAKDVYLVGFLKTAQRTDDPYPCNYDIARYINRLKLYKMIDADKEREYLKSKINGLHLPPMNILSQILRDICSRTQHNAIPQKPVTSSSSQGHRAPPRKICHEKKTFIPVEEITVSTGN